MMGRTLLASAIVTALIALPSVRAEEHYDPAKLSAALKDVKMPLQDGIKASASKGKPISAKYEVEDGALQLSVYTAGNGKFYEVIVDHKTGKVAKTEQITAAKADDLKAAKDQLAAMAKAKTSLADAADKAVKANAGFRAVSVTPETKGGHSTAEVLLVSGSNFKTVAQPLD